DAQQDKYCRNPEQFKVTDVFTPFFFQQHTKLFHCLPATFRKISSNDAFCLSIPAMPEPSSAKALNTCCIVGPSAEIGISIRFFNLSIGHSCRFSKWAAACSVSNRSRIRGSAWRFLTSSSEPCSTSFPSFRKRT